MKSLSDKRMPPWKDSGDDFYRGKDVKEFIKQLKEDLFGNHGDQYVVGIGRIKETIDKLAGDKLI